MHRRCNQKRPLRYSPRMGLPGDAFEGAVDESSSWDDSHPMRAVRPTPAVVSGDVAHDAAKDGVLAALGLTQAPTLRRFGRYIVLGVLGRGGMGTVLKAYDEELDRQVALKLLHSDLTERSTRRLRREAQALAKLDHPNVVKVFEVDEAEGQAFVAMQLVKGTTLEAWQRQEPRRGWKECVEAYLQAGRGLAAAHEAGLVHRDFKPANCIIDEKRRVQVLDFGLARGLEGGVGGEIAGGETDVRPEPKDDALRSSLTSTGRAMGTVAYMPLEQLEGKPADARSDQFSFCASLYEAVYGERPFEGCTAAALATTISEELVRVSPKGVKVPARLRQVVLRGLAARPEARWASMDVLLVELQRMVAPRTRRWLALGVAVGLIAVGVGLGIGEYTEVMNRCAGARAQLDGIWDEGRRQGVKDAILGTKLSYAADTWERVEQGLDEYAGAWATKHADVCEATNVRQEQSAEVMDLRMGCLRSRRAALRKAVGVLAKADETRVKKAVRLVADLPRLSRCDEVVQLHSDHVVARFMIARALSPNTFVGHNYALTEQAREVFAEIQRREAGEVDPKLLAETRFLFARALWSNRATRSRAYELAEQARDALTEFGTDGDADNLAYIQQWLAEHRER
jgi:predicted Ser/Thr protein kinase